MNDLDSCSLCLGTRRTDVHCDDGWVEVEPYDHETGTAARMAPCKAWQAMLAARRQAVGLHAANLDEAQYTASWDELHLADQGWREAHEVALSVHDVVRDGLNLILVGATGRGKTHAGVLIAKAAMQAGYTAVKIDWARFLDGVRDSFNDKTVESEGKQIERLVNADFLMIDDIGSGDGDSNNFSTSRLEKIITRRYDAKRPTLVTANFKASDLTEVVGARTASRLRGRHLVLTFAGQAYRESVEREEVASLIHRIRTNARGGRA